MDRADRWMRLACNSASPTPPIDVFSCLILPRVHLFILTVRQFVTRQEREALKRMLAKLDADADPGATQSDTTTHTPLPA
jgi:hypothetical protein